MPNNVSNTVGLLINNAHYLPDATDATSTSIATVAAAGTTQLTATPVSAQITLISNNTTANGVILPVGVIGQVIVLFPQLVTNAPKVYPPIGGNINGGAVNANTTAAAQAKTLFYCVSQDGLSWI